MVPPSYENATQGAAHQADLRASTPSSNENATQGSGGQADMQALTPSSNENATTPDATTKSML